MFPRNSLRPTTNVLITQQFAYTYNCQFGAQVSTVGCTLGFRRRFSCRDSLTPARLSRIRYKCYYFNGPMPVGIDTIFLRRLYLRILAKRKKKTKRTNGPLQPMQRLYYNYYYNITVTRSRPCAVKPNDFHNFSFSSLPRSLSPDARRFQRKLSPLQRTPPITCYNILIMIYRVHLTSVNFRNLTPCARSLIRYV